MFKVTCPSHGVMRIIMKRLSTRGVEFHRHGSDPVLILDGDLGCQISKRFSAKVEDYVAPTRAVPEAKPKPKSLDKKTAKKKYSPRTEEL